MQARLYLFYSVGITVKLLVNSIVMSIKTEVTAKSGATRSTRSTLLLIIFALLIAVAAAGCASAAPSVSDIRAEYRCSYSLTVRGEDTTLEEVASREMPRDLYDGEWWELDPSGQADAQISWIQSVRAINEITGDVPEGTTLEIPAKCDHPPMR